MFKKYILHVLLLVILINCVVTQNITPGPSNNGPSNNGPSNNGPSNSGPSNFGPVNTRPVNAGPNNTGSVNTGSANTGPANNVPPNNGPTPSYFRHPNDESFYDMEKKGKKPKDFFKLENSDNPNISVDVVELKDQDKNNDIITNKSKLKITWNVGGPNNMNKNDNLPKSFTIKLLSNVTQDSETQLFYSSDTQIIQTNINEYQFEYNVPKLDENYVYNIAVMTDTNGKAQSDIGISKTFIYSKCFN